MKESFFRLFLVYSVIFFYLATEQIEATESSLLEKNIRRGL